MGEIPNRDKIDADLTASFAAELARQRDRALRLLGDPPNPTNVPQAYWGQLAAAVHHTLYHDLELAYATAARQQAGEFRTPIDDAELAAAATQWASEHVGELAIRFVNKTQEAVTEKVREYQAEEEKRKSAIAALLLLTDYRHPWSILGLPSPEPIKLPKPPAEMTPAERAAELNKIEAARRDWMGRYLDVPFGAGRAEGVAVTGVTTARVGGERRAGAEHTETTGDEIEAFWETKEDAKVCPICKPLDGLPQSQWPPSAMAGPPQHPNCRCRLRYRVVRKAAAA